ncbi:hypothetical protein EDD22DRAFT_847013 [Suillus occidentalis]|nr:hypothetical protein EDD22DRAFT_847013 [Suillus occidentalis]
MRYWILGNVRKSKERPSSFAQGWEGPESNEVKEQIGKQTVSDTQTIVLAHDSFMGCNETAHSWSNNTTRRLIISFGCANPAALTIIIVVLCPGIVIHEFLKLSETRYWLEPYHSQCLGNIQVSFVQRFDWNQVLDICGCGLF